MQSKLDTIFKDFVNEIDLALKSSTTSYVMLEKLIEKSKAKTALKEPRPQNGGLDKGGASPNPSHNHVDTSLPEGWPSPLAMVVGTTIGLIGTFMFTAIMAGQVFTSMFGLFLVAVGFSLTRPDIVLGGNDMAAQDSKQEHKQANPSSTDKGV